MDGPHGDGDAIVPSRSHRAAVGRLLAAGAAALAIAGLDAGGAATRPSKRASGNARRRPDRAAEATPRQGVPLVRVVKQSGTLGVNKTLALTAACSPGEIATGGGFDVETSTAGVFVQRDPPKENPPTSWTATFINTGRQSPSVSAFVVCMTVFLSDDAG